MPRAATTFLIFDGNAEQAMTFYVSLFRGEATRVEKYGPGEHGKEGSIEKAGFTLAGHRLACIDSPIKHTFTVEASPDRP